MKIMIKLYLHGLIKIVFGIKTTKICRNYYGLGGRGARETLVLSIAFAPYL